MDYIYTNGELYHHGVKGMKWGVRRYQKKNGTLTPAGKKRYEELSKDYKSKKFAYKVAKKEYSESFYNAYKKRLDAYSLSKTRRQVNSNRWDDANNKAEKYNKAKNEYKAARKVLKELKKIEKQEYKDFVDKRSKEILAGESAVTRIYDNITNAHKYQAQIEYNIDKRAKNDDRYRD